MRTTDTWNATSVPGSAQRTLCATAQSVRDACSVAADQEEVGESDDADRDVRRLHLELHLHHRTRHHT